MRAYTAYFDRQTVSDNLHQRLLALGEKAPDTKAAPAAETAERKRSFLGGNYMKFGALAACAALLIGIGSYLGGSSPVAPKPGPIIPPATVQTIQPSAPAESENALAVEPTLAPDDSAIADTGAFRLMENPDVCRSFYAMPGLKFVDASDEPEIAASIALPEGSFEIDLTLADLQKMFWGKEGKPKDMEPDTELPWALYWGGCTVWARAIYDGEGKLWQLTVHGEREGDEFTLRVAPGQLPVDCCVVLSDEEEATADVNGVPVTSYHRIYDRDGDGKDEVICTSEFMAGGYGYRFENIGAPQMVGETYDREAAIYFNTLFVRQALSDGGLYLDEVARNEDIPAWASEKLNSLAQALEYEEFAPYLPQEELPGYAQFVGNKDFGGRYNYHEGRDNSLFVRWSRNYDDVEVEVHIPEGKSNDYYEHKLVDAGVPESYDWRLYDGPICDSVPEEYKVNFYKPTFRGSEISLEVVKARMREHDTGGEICHFYVLHENGVVVGYDCAGVSAEYVWSLVEATLPAV